MSDEDLAEAMFVAVFGRSRDWDFTAESDQERWMRGIRALRAALTPAVAPLRPGETVTIPSVGEFALPVKAGDDYLGVGGIRLDAAGVAQLRDVCDRWEAAQGERE